MAQKPRLLDIQEREHRQRSYQACSTLAEQFPQIEELALDLRFIGAEHKPLLSPYRQIFRAGMQAFFELQCPSHHCSGGGFDLRGAVGEAARTPDEPASGRLYCRGARTDRPFEGQACAVALNYGIELVLRAA